MPSPREGESKGAFVSRCMGDGEMNSEFPDEKQRYAVCNKYFTNPPKAEVDKSLDSSGLTMSCECGGSCCSTDAEADTDAGYPPNCNDGFKTNDAGTTCVPVAVTIEMDITDYKVVAGEKNYHIEITGVAFHEGMNKNNWSLTREGALAVIQQMVGADITLNHPDATEHGVGFSRNMDGGVEQAPVGHITQANLYDILGGGWEVRYVAKIVRDELFESLESGVWSRENYGVSIGGSGIPVETSDDGITFGEDFSFDHMAIVHKPAYSRANIETVRKVLLADEQPKAVKQDDIFISHSIPAVANEPEGTAMSEDNIADTESQNEAHREEIEAIQAELILSKARVQEYEETENARVEEDRQNLVDEATTLGMSGHDDLSSDTLTTLIASWREAHPEPEPVELKPVEESTTVVEASEPTSEANPVVANFLNGKLVQSDEKIYERCWNAWAKAWNGTLAHEEKSTMRAPMYAEAKELI